MFRPYMWAIIRLRFNLQGVAIQAVWDVFESIGGWGVGGNDISFFSIVGIMTWGYYKWIIISCLCTHIKLGFFDICTQKTNDNPLVITPGHDIHY